MKSQEDSVKVNGHLIHVEVQGSGQPLLLLNGIGANVGIWEPLLRHLQGFEVITFDMPGTGRSPASRRPRTIPELARLTAGVLGALGFPRVDVLGYSFGGLVAQQLAVQHWRRVRRLALVATTFGVGSIMGDLRAWRHLLSARYRPGDFESMGPDLVGGRTRVDSSRLRAHDRRRAALPPTRWGFYSQALAGFTWSALPLLPFLSQPTLILAGDDDPLIPTINPRAMHRLIRRSELVIVEGAGHLLLIDSPEEVAPIIRRFFKAEEAATALTVA